MHNSTERPLKKQQHLKENILEKAFRFAEKVHEGQKRLSGDPYIEHPKSVKKILELHPFSEKVLCAALLHDVIEDSRNPKQTEDELFKEFGNEISFLVDAVTKDKNFATKEERDQYYQEKFSYAIKRDYSVMFLKAADLLDNLMTLQHHAPEKQAVWIKELKSFYLHHFLENFYRIPEEFRDFFHYLLYQLQKVIDDFERNKP